MRHALKTSLSHLVFLSSAAFLISLFSSLPSFGMTEEKKSHPISTKTRKEADGNTDGQDSALKKQSCDPPPASSQLVIPHLSIKPSLNNISKDLVCHIGRFLLISEMVALAITSKQQKTNLDQSSLWSTLTDKSGIKISIVPALTDKNPKEVHPADRATASFYKALMWFAARTNVINGAIAYELFHAVSQNQAADLEIRARASLYKARMRIEGRTQAITDDEAYVLLLDVSQNQAALSEERKMANRIMEAMKLIGRIS